jgi:hypothetical protein
MTDQVRVPLDPDQETPEAPARAGVGFTGDQFDRLIDAIRGGQSDQVEAQAQIHALAMKKQLRPENETHPDISVFNPRGERDHPRPRLMCEMFLGPYPLERDVLTWRELELLNQLEPGLYDITKADGSVVPFHVIPRLRADGRTVERLTIAFPCADDDQKQNFPPFATMLREVVDQIEVRKLTDAR